MDVRYCKTPNAIQFQWLRIFTERSRRLEEKKGKVSRITFHILGILFFICIIHPCISAPPNPYLFFDQNHITGEWSPKLERNTATFLSALQSCCLARETSVLQKDGIEFVLTIKVDFSDQPGQRAGAEIDGFLYAEEGVSLKTYYKEVSYGQMDIQPGPVGGVIPRGNNWFRAEEPMGYYGVGQFNIDRYRQLVGEACRAADAIVDFTQYDRDGNGVIDHLFILHAGDDEASTFTGIYGDNIWSVLVQNVNRRFDGVLIDTAILVGEEPSFDKPHLGIYFHEFFHDFGAPDIYGASFTDARDNKWGLMGAFGPYQGELVDGVGDGLQPSHIIGYMKWDFDARPENGRLGWIEPIEIQENRSKLQISSFELPPKDNKLFKINIPGKVDSLGNSVEFFLIENRYRESGAMFDTHVPESGILIWHIDDTKARASFAVDASAQIWLEDPTDPDHLGINPTNPNAPQNIKFITDGAAYSADDGQISFTPATRPASNANDGSISGISITNIGFEGQSIPITISFGDTYEPNDDLANAFPIEPNQTYESFLFDEGDRQDFYRFDAIKGQAILMTLTDIPDEVDYRLLLLDAQGQQIAVAEKIDLSEQRIVYQPDRTETLHILIESRFGFSDVDSYILTIDAVETESRTLQLAQIRVFPNPFRAEHSEMTFSYTIADLQLAEEVELYIFTLAGDLIHTDIRQNVVGSNRFRWNGKSNKGSVIASGIYVYVISATQGEETVRQIGKIGVVR